MARYSTIDEGLEKNHKKIEKMSYLFAAGCFLLSFFLKRWFIYSDIIITIILILIFSIVCFHMRMNYVGNINRWFYARFYNRSYSFVFLITVFAFSLCTLVFFALLFRDFFVFFSEDELATSKYSRFGYFVLNDEFLGAIISKVMVFYAIIFIEEFIVIFIVLFKILFFREKTINDIMSYSKYYSVEAENERRK